MISVADLKAALRITHANDDAYIEDLEVRAVAYVERYTGKSFTEGDETEYVRGSDDGVLYLSHPASAVTSVNEQLYPGGERTAVVEADDDGFVIRGSKLIRKGGSLWSSLYEYEVVYTKDATPPDDIVQAVEQLVVRWYSIRLGLALGTVAPEVPNSVSSILNAHRRPRV